LVEQHRIAVSDLKSPAVHFAEQYQDVVVEKTILIIGGIMSENNGTLSVVGRQADTSFTGDTIFPKGEKNEAYARYFTGTSYLEMLSTEGVTIGNVTFEPGCRNFWHIHHKGGQILLVTGGRGWYQEAGKPARELRAGDVVNIPPETKHWHGAAKDSWFVHVAVEVPAEGGSSEWLEPVSDEEYNRLK
jgi:quercetin dioxygenase-like cupin family protein